MSSSVKRIEELRRELRRHDHLYYVEARPEISDRRYDELMAELKALEDAHAELVTVDSPTQRVGGEPIEGFETVEHSAPMLSIDNTYNADELNAFDERVRKALGEASFSYLVDPKIDGVAVALRYENGLLARAVTRGDGRRGDDITNNARRIRSVPLRLRGEGWPEVVEVRGEIYWPRKAFNEFNAQRVAAGAETFANPRNGTAGTLKQLDPTIVAQRHLAFLAHGFGELSDSIADTAEGVMQAFRSWSVPVSRSATVCPDIARALEAIQDWAKLRQEAEYETDGMVVKVNELDLRAQLGATSKYPRWCIAYKYQAEQARTVLREVSFQVGRLGTITPVAHFDPVQLSGTTVSNASLHNFDQVERLGVRVGDTIVVEKAGEIIPQVVQVLHEKRPRDAAPIEPPQTCPHCSGSAERDEGGVYLRCVNPECPAQIRQRLEFFAGRNQMDIANLGPAVIDQLVARGLVQHFADLYALKVEDLVELERMGDKSARNLVDSIAASKARGLGRLLAALGIRHVGTSTADLLAKGFSSMEELLSAEKKQIRKVITKVSVVAQRLREALHEGAFPEDARGDDIRRLAKWMHGFKIEGLAKKDTKLVAQKSGDLQGLLNATDEDLTWCLREENPRVIAESLYGYLHSKVGKDTIRRLSCAGVAMKSQQTSRAATGPLSGQSVVVTGTLEGLSRNEAERIVKEAGGKVTSSVSGKTSFLVVGESPGDKKLAQARKFGIETLNEQEFLERAGRKGKESREKHHGWGLFGDQ